MNSIFLTFLNMSLIGAFVIVAICLVRLPLKKAPKTISYCLWAVAGFRLLFPVSIESVFSLIPFKAEIIPADIAMQSIPRIDSGVLFVDNIVSESLPVPAIDGSVNPLQVWVTMGSYIWLIGAAIMIIYGVASYFILKQKMQRSLCIDANIFEATNIKSPFVLGIFSPRIYLPTGLSEQELEYVIMHERTHIQRRDHIVKFVAYFILCLHWFNPLAWVAFILMGTDMEMSCDERVLKDKNEETKKKYSLSLLSLATDRRIIGGSPLAFGEGGAKERIKHILNFKKSSRIIIIVAIVVVAVLTLCLVVNRSNTDSTVTIPDIIATDTINGSQAKGLTFGYSWNDGKKAVEADSIVPWQGEYASENTLVLDGQMGQNMIALSVEKPISARYEVYMPDGSLYDDGSREVYESRGTLLYWTEDKSGIGIIAPFEPGEYYYAVTIGWEKHELTVTYGFKIITTGEYNSYDEALRIVWEHNTDAMSVTLTGSEILPGAEYAGDCYTFDIDYSNRTERVAVSKDQGIYFTYNENTWFAFTGAAEQSNNAKKYMTLADVRAIAQKIGPDLVMSDLSDFVGERYYGDNSTPGLQVTQYYIFDAPYLLVVGSLDGENLLSSDFIHAVEGGTNESIDIRYYDVDKFITDETKELVRNIPPSSIHLPDFLPIEQTGTYEGKEYEAIINSSIIKQYGGHENEFLIFSSTFFGGYEESEKLKVFVTVHFVNYSLEGKALTETSGGVIPCAIIYTEVADGGGWAQERFIEIGGTPGYPDGGSFSDSINKLCVQPVSGKKIAGLAQTIINDYSNNTKRIESLRENLISHLLRYGQTGVYIQEAGGRKVDLT